ncbi:uncharacterized protein LOC144609293 [Rhinoraja longicauda]
MEKIRSMLPAKGASGTVYRPQQNAEGEERNELVLKLGADEGGPEPSGTSDLSALISRASKSRTKVLIFLALAFLLFLLIAFLLGYVTFRNTCQSCPADTGSCMAVVNDEDDGWQSQDYSYDTVLHWVDLKAMLAKYLDKEQLTQNIKIMSGTAHPAGSSELNRLDEHVLNTFDSYQLSHVWADSHYVNLPNPDSSSPNYVQLVDSRGEIRRRIQLTDQEAFLAYSATGNVTARITDYGSLSHRLGLAQRPTAARRRGRAASLEDKEQGRDSGNRESPSFPVITYMVLCSHRKPGYHVFDTQNPIRLIKMAGLSRSLDSNLDSSEHLPDARHVLDRSGKPACKDRLRPVGGQPVPAAAAVAAGPSGAARPQGGERACRGPRGGRRWAAEAEDVVPAVAKMRLRTTQPRPNCWSLAWPQEQEPVGRASHARAQGAARPAEQPGRPRGARGNYLGKNPPEELQPADPLCHQESLQSKTKRVEEAVHGVTTEECQEALRLTHHDTQRAIQHLKIQQLYNMSRKTHEECVHILQEFNWSLENASHFLLKTNLKS